MPSCWFCHVLVQMIYVPIDIVYIIYTFSAAQCHYVLQVVVYLEQYVVEFSMLYIIVLSLQSYMHILYPHGFCCLLEL